MSCSKRPVADRSTAWLVRSLTVFSVLALISLGVKAWVDVDTTWDTWEYHLPIAARIWEIIPHYDFKMNSHMEALFQGVPLLAEILQGFFWKIFQRPEAANLVAYLSLLGFLAFLKRIFNVPLYMSVFSLLAIPAVQTHATICYVDLPSGLSLSAFALMVYLLYTRNTYPSPRFLGALLFFAAITNHMKLIHLLVVFAGLAFTLLRIVYLKFKVLDGVRQRVTWLIFPLFPLWLVVNLVIFAIPIRNLMVHGDILYPMRNQTVFSEVKVVLPGSDVKGSVPASEVKGNQSVSDAKGGALARKPSPVIAPIHYPKHLKYSIQPKRWVYSLFEIGRPMFRWSIDQRTQRKFNPGNRLGGFFFIAVIVNLLLLAVMMIRVRNRQTLYAGCIMLVMSLIYAFMPHSHILRFSMAWMIVLVSLNCHLVVSLRNLPGPVLSGIRPVTHALVHLALFLVVVQATHAKYVTPQFYSFKYLMQDKVSLPLLAQFKSGERSCILGQEPYEFLYSHRFHPAQNYQVFRPPRMYSVFASLDPIYCGKLNVVQERKQRQKGRKSAKAP